MRDFKTFEMGDDIVHYSCQSVKLPKTIQEIGDQFGIGKNEVLKIPKKELDKRGMFYRTQEEAQINCEKLLNLLNK